MMKRCPPEADREPRGNSPSPSSSLIKGEASRNRVQEEASCRGFGGVPRFPLFFPHEWGHRGLREGIAAFDTEEIEV